MDAQERPVESGGDIRPESLDRVLEMAFGGGRARAAPTTTRGPRYAVLGEIRRDDESLVRRAYDREMERTVAVRSPRRDCDPAAVAGLLAEAQVCAQLQHPGIVPVYDMGVGEDGRPFVATQLVEGETLAVRLARREEQDGLLPVVERVARTLAYAHARGVVHGALAPECVHVGARGEVHVVGWGRTDGGDARDDVRALGCMLSVVPETGLDDSLADLACRCEDGRIDARSLAVALDLHQTAAEDRARRAEIEATRTRARAEEERIREAAARRTEEHARRGKRRVRTIAGVVLVAVLVAVAGFAWTRSEEAVAAARVEAEGTAALREAERLEASGDPAGARAAAVKAAALARGAGGTPAVRMRAEALLAGIDERRRRIEADQRLRLRLEDLRTLGGPGRQPVAIAEEYAEAFREAGIELEGLDAESVAAALLASGDPAGLAAAVDTWARQVKDPARRRAMIEGARLADPDPWRDAVRVAALRGDREALRALAARTDVSRQAPPTLVLLTFHLEQLGDATAAARLLLETERRHPGDSRVPVVLTRQLGWVLGAETSRPLRLATSAVARDPTRASLWKRVSMLLQRRGDPAAALAAARRAVGLDPADPDCWVTLSAARTRSGDREGSREACRRALELDSRCAMAHNNLGVLWIQEDRPDRAEEAFRRAIELDPDLPEALANLAVTLQRRGENEKALALARRALELDPRCAGAHLARGNALGDTDRLAEAARALRRAVDLDPPNWRARHDLGAALIALGRPAEALPHLEAAAECEPDHVDVLLSLSAAHAHLGHREKALAAVDRALAAEPANVSALGNRGLFLQELGRPDEAVATLRRACALAPDRSDVHGNLAFVLLREQRLEEAVEPLRRFVELEPGKAAAGRKLALVLGQLALSRVARPTADQEMAREAVRLAEEAVRRAPSGLKGPMGCVLGLALFRAGEDERAVEVIERALAAGRGPEGLAQLVLAMANFRLGREEAARDWHRRAVAWIEAHDPEDEDLKRLRAESEALLSSREDGD